MRLRHLIGSVVIIIFTILFAASGLVGSQSKNPAKNVIIEKTIQTVATQNRPEPVSIAEPNSSIFSNTILFSLIVVIAGVVAFRREIDS
ncbi:MAG: hypothetical protein ACK2TV_16225 [Anaerolineales bacterium]|jgi:hypothetical protein